MASMMPRLGRPPKVWRALHHLPGRTHLVREILLCVGSWMRSVLWFHTFMRVYRPGEIWERINKYGGDGNIEAALDMTVPCEQYQG